MRTLSSRQTFFFKVLFPAIWIGGWGFATLQLILHPETIVYNGVKGAPPHAWLVSLGLWVIGSVFVLAPSWGFKRVRVDGSELVISNYLREARVPLALVSEVRRRRFALNGSVTLDFDVPNVFGNSTTFLARGGAVSLGGEMRVARDVREMARLARLGSSPSMPTSSARPPPNGF